LNDVPPNKRVQPTLYARRTAVINEIHGFLLERGITFAAKPIHLRNHMPASSTTRW
jgi:transposase